MPSFAYKVYEVATIRRLPKIIGLFCRTQYLLWGSFAKETCDFQEPNNRSHPIVSRSLSIHMNEWCLDEAYMCACVRERDRDTRDSAQKRGREKKRKRERKG